MKNTPLWDFLYPLHGVVTDFSSLEHRRSLSLELRLMQGQTTNYGHDSINDKIGQDSGSSALFRILVILHEITTIAEGLNVIDVVGASL
jgi:hypothetical protein